ncbi:MAG: hypothetical protein ACPHPA_06365, partial [Cycloclasticus pugetii]
MNTTTLYDLSSSKKIIAFSGEDAAHFLQGQTTCDVLTLKNSDAVFGAVCNPKGRVITLFHLIKHDETYYMVLSSDMASIIIKRMKMFVFRSKVEITDASNDYKVFGINQPLPPAMSSLLAPLKSIKYQSDSELSLLIVATQQYTTAKTDPSIALQSNETDWQLLLINECIPEITTETSELFIPQMLNMDLLNGINFQKDKFKIDLFAMSCRVLGRYLENWILNKIKDYAKIKKRNFIQADFIKGPRNNIFKQFLLDNGFSNIRKKNE